jgi:hypothetical protein
MEEVQARGLVPSFASQTSGEAWAASNTCATADKPDSPYLPGITIDKAQCRGVAEEE